MLWRTGLILVMAVMVSAMFGSTKKKIVRQEAKFLNGLYDAASGQALDHLKQALGHGAEPYGEVKITSSTMSAWDRKDIENIAQQNEVDFRKEVELRVRDCKRHPDAGKIGCWNSCLDPILDVERHESISINPGNTGVNRLQRVTAVICPWHIRSDRVSFSKDNVTVVRNRGRKHPQNKSKLTDDAGHLIASLLGGSTDIDSNAVAQAVVSNRAGDWRRSETKTANFLKHNGSKDGKRMVLYDIMLAYDDTSDSASAPTRPAVIHYVGNFYEWQPDETFKLVEIIVEMLDNGPDDAEYEQCGAKVDL